MKTRKLIPMLFSTPMVEAIGKGTKTQTRRVVKPQPECINNETAILMTEFLEKLKELEKKGLTDIKTGTRGHVFPKCPYGKPGDIIWVRETWNERSQRAMDMGFEKYYYKAGWEGCTDGGWKPNMHMPLRACRYFLEVKSVRVERLKDISKKDAIAEGIERGTEHLKSLFLDYGGNKVYASGKFNLRRTVWIDPISSYKSLWASINGLDSWDANPWVWVVEFEVIGLDLMMAYFQDILESYDEKRRGKVHSDLVACMVRLSETKEEGV